VRGNAARDAVVDDLDGLDGEVRAEDIDMQNLIAAGYMWLCFASDSTESVSGVVLSSSLT
jgi:hypothetical protein